MTDHTYEQVIPQTYDSKSATPQNWGQIVSWRSNFVLNGERKAEYAVVNHEEVLEAWPLLAGLLSKRLN
jgi:hypothetical protein